MDGQPAAADEHEDAALLGTTALAASASAHGAEALIALSRTFIERTHAAMSQVAAVEAASASAALASAFRAVGVECGAYADAVAALPAGLRAEAVAGVVPHVLARLVRLACAHVGGGGAAEGGVGTGAAEGGGWSPMTSRDALAGLVRAWDPALDDGPVLVLRYAALLLPGTAHHFDTVVDAPAHAWLCEQARAALARFDADAAADAAADAGVDASKGDGAALREHLARLAGGQLPYGLRADEERAVPQLRTSLSELLTPDGAARALALDTDARAWLAAAAERALAAPDTGPPSTVVDADADAAASSAGTAKDAAPTLENPVPRRTRKYLVQLARTGTPPGFAAALP